MEGTQPDAPHGHHLGYGLGPPVEVEKGMPWWQTALLALLFIGGGAFLLSRMTGDKMQISWKCVGRAFGRVSCTFTAEKGHGRVCVEILLPCADGQHRHELCSPPLREGGSGDADMTLSQFSPPLSITDLHGCRGLAFGARRFEAE